MDKKHTQNEISYEKNKLIRTLHNENCINNEIRVHGYTNKFQNPLFDILNFYFRNVSSFVFANISIRL
jgi:hypothetical protein